MNVLFICVENTCRSVMAEAIFNSLAKKSRAKSVGILKGREIDGRVLKLLRSKGYKVAKKEPESLEEVSLDEFDLIVTVCEESSCVSIPGRVISWSIEDPKGKGEEAYEKVLKILEDKVKRLLEEIENEDT